MPIPLFAMCLALLPLAEQPRGQTDLAALYDAAEEAKEAYRQDGHHEQALQALSAAYAAYEAAEPEERRKGANARRFEILTYDLAATYALLGQADSALAYLGRYYDMAFATYSTSYRGIDHYHIARDPDLDRIREDPRFQDLLSRFAATSWQSILRRHGDYEAIASPLPRFVYVNSDWENLPELKRKYDLEAIAGPGDDVSQILNLMRWVHDTIRHDGNSGEPEDRHADALIQLSRRENRGLNCWMLATVLNEACLAMGYRSRIVSCYPQGDPSITHEWHVIDEVYATSLHKWIWVDPTLETWVEDERGNLLGIAEVRGRLVAGLPVFASPDLNCNGEPYDGGSDRYLHDYMAKNLFRIAIPLFSMPAYEMVPRKARIYVELLPAGYNPRHVRFHEITGESSSTIYTTDAAQFWALPVGME